MEKYYLRFRSIPVPTVVMCCEGETALCLSLLAFILALWLKRSFWHGCFQIAVLFFSFFPQCNFCTPAYCFASLQYFSFCVNIGLYLPVIFPLTLHCCLHCPSLCWTHLHLCKVWERNSTLQCPICSSHCTGVEDKIWDCQELGLAQATQALSYACNLRFRKHGNRQFSFYAVVQWYGIKS